jgi:hypothetical protein
MTHIRNPLRALSLVVLAMLLIQQFGCGTILYPERKGQQGGNIDAGVAVLDGIGLLIFIVPGVIAFAVDFATGAIYLPGGDHSSIPKDSIKVVRVSPSSLRHLTTIKEIVVREGLMPANVDLEKADVIKVEHPEQIPTLLAVCRQTGYRTP